MEAHSRTRDDTLEYKLQGGSVPTRLVDKLGILLARIGAQVHPRHHYASEMVAGNMATLLGVDLARESCVTVYASEPALACAAGRIRGKDPMLEGEFIPALHEAVIFWALKNGRKNGEIIAQMILLLAFDKVCKMCGKGQSGLDLLIPILHGSLAAVVVQAKTCVAKPDANYPRSAGLKLRSSVAFKDGPLAKRVELTKLDANTVRIDLQLGVVWSTDSWIVMTRLVQLLCPRSHFNCLEYNSGT
eukprot:gene5870-biopygen6214